MALVAGALALGVGSGKPPTYEATALLSVDQTQETGQGFDVAIQADQFLTQRFVSMATSRPVLEQVCAKEGRGCAPTALARKVRATTPKATAQIQITAAASSPSDAIRIANDTADALVVRYRVQVDGQLASQRAYLQDQLKQLNDQLNRTMQQIQAAETIGRPAAGLLSLQSLQQAQYSSTYQRLQDLDIQRTRLSNVISVAQPAVPPASKVDPDPVRYILVGVTGGLVVGLLMALAAERLRNKIRHSSELAETVGSKIVLDMSNRRASGGASLYGFLAHASLAGLPPSARALLVVATRPHDRVNDVGLELARALAEKHERILVVLAASPDAGAVERREVRTDESSMIVVQPAERPAPELRPGEEFDLVIRCALPPMQEGGHTWLKSVPERAILVATRGRCRFSSVRRTAELLRHIGVEIVGAILLPRRGKPAPKTPLPEPERAAGTAAAVEQ
jgi:capsular polysaccharide biosynthesis protein